MSARAQILADSILPSRTHCRSVFPWVEPVSVFGRIADQPGSILLESQPGAGGRYSTIWTAPFGTLKSERGRAILALPTGVRRGESALNALRTALSRYASRAHAEAVPFAGGGVGYLGYELHTDVEDLPAPASIPDDLALPNCWLGFYNCALVFDHLEHTIALVWQDIPGVPEPMPELENLERLVLEAAGEDEVPVPPEIRSCGAPSSSFTKVGYCEAVRTVKEYIAAGDVYQVNLSQRFSVRTAASPWETYLRLRESNPAPYAAYLNLGPFQVVSSSPECFLTLDPTTRMVETRPIKGTRPRGFCADEDRRLARELASSAKDRAENVMIVDLERNDLGRVCEFGSVRVPRLAHVESHPTVHHLVSTVTGVLRADRDQVDLLQACFPGGSITGAPKIRAMEIIDELEPVRRSIYTGSIGYVGFDGSVNLNIAIRTAIFKEGFCHFHVGGGIVADSDPDMEYQETLDKGRAFFEVLGCP